jgi:hypothetical protein
MELQLGDIVSESVFELNDPTGPVLVSPGTGGRDPQLEFAFRSDDESKERGVAPQGTDFSSEVIFRPETESSKDEQERFSLPIKATRTHN